MSSTTENGYKPWYLEECASTLTTTYSSGAFYERKIVSARQGGQLGVHTFRPLGMTSFFSEPKAEPGEGQFVPGPRAPPSPINERVVPWGTPQSLGCLPQTLPF